MTDVKTTQACSDCQALKGAGRSIQPHLNLHRVSCNPIGSPMGPSDEDHYSCRICSKTWLHETGSMGFGWVE